MFLKLIKISLFLCALLNQTGSSQATDIKEETIDIVIENPTKVENKKSTKIKDTIENIKKNNIDVIDLSRSGIVDSFGADEIGEALNKNTSVRILDLSSNAISNEGTWYILKALTNNSTLKELSLSCNKFIGTEYIPFAFLLPIFHELVPNHISNDMLYKKIKTTLVKNKSLEKLSLNFVNLGKNGSTQIAYSLEKNSTLKYLSICGCNIDNKGAIEISKYLAKNTGLENLDISKNNIGDEGALKLLKSLKENKNLKQINLSQNNISDEGIQIGKILCNNNSLEKLNLSKNNITNDGASQIVETLFEKQNSLKEVDLSENQIDDEGAQKILEYLWSKNSYNLPYVSLRNNNISEDVKKMKWNDTDDDNNKILYLNIFM